MQIVFLGDDLHEIPNPILGKERNISLLPAGFAQSGKGYLMVLRVSGCTRKQSITSISSATSSSFRLCSVKLETITSNFSFVSVTVSYKKYYNCINIFILCV